MQFRKNLHLCPLSGEKIAYKTANGIQNLLVNDILVLRATFSIPGTAPSANEPDQTTQVVDTVHRCCKDQDWTEEQLITSLSEDPIFVKLHRRYPSMKLQQLEFLTPEQMQESEV